jgi:hypothetical protein
MEQMEMNNMYINVGVNKDSENYTEKTLRLSLKSEGGQNYGLVTCIYWTLFLIS